jgi:hypothetical protein
MEYWRKRNKLGKKRWNASPFQFRKRELSKGQEREEDAYTSFLSILLPSVV